MDGYKVQFVGLAYFLPKADGRHVLLPDGRNIPDVKEHIATIAVAADDLAGDDPFTGWSEDAIMRTSFEGRELVQFVLSGDSIDLEGASNTVRDEPLTADVHAASVQHLTSNGNGPRVTIVARDARTVADVRIRRGELHAFRYPGSDDDGTGAIISELRVPHDRDTVTITVRPKGDGNVDSTSSESDVRTITVGNGSEIAIVNASRPHDNTPDDETQHFRIYLQLAPGRLTLGDPRPTPIPFPASPTEHLLFRIPGVIGSSVKCSNNCC